MILFFINEEEIEKNSPYIPQIRRLYNLCFPDINEREEFNHILGRVKGLRKEFDPNTIMVVYIEKIEVIAGMIVDWYNESQCIHITYIFVHPRNRNKGIAKRFLTNELNNLISQIYNKYYIRIKSIFLEANIPSQTKIDSFNSETRLKIFKKIGIKWIDIPYIQPALDNNKSKVNNLYLFTIPINILDSEEMNIDYIIDFLSSLYRSLKIEKLEMNLDFLKMVTSLHKQRNSNNCIKLKQINV